MLSLQPLDEVRRPSAADILCDELYHRVVTLELPPGTKLSEQDVARQAGVSRQPVRDAFWRLSQLGLLTIQPQRATTVSRISAEGVRQARFIRTAVETETTRAAAEAMTAEHLKALETLVEAQARAMAADDRLTFHALDDAFHRAICAASGNEFAWALIRNHKAHMDRVRYLSLAFGTRAAYDDHVEILVALRRRDADAAVCAMRVHLSRIASILAQLREERPEMFVGGGA